MTPTLTPQSELDTIRAMARADHAQRLTSAYNPYPQGTDKAAAWDAGWREENDASHRLDEEIVKLPRFRVRVEIVAGEGQAARPLDLLDREDFSAFTVSQLRRDGDKAVIWESPEARARFPEEQAVGIRVTHEGDEGMFD
ncbi:MULTISPECIES: hypothetical protein [Sphingobium]|uniref:hypothetical protein n=1 Tax=Sphingobium TaxID=165695 RepID=UPI000C394E53|nr:MULTISPECIES: hypothetical protein [Sphingobium]MBS48949.1 hypothetical protein [Sphingobium sp.]MCC4256272.1 hypothetical protein [Sphingobium lactosutens]HCW62024.1 hypothetical protein [Sphingobium sp.]